MKHIRPTTKAIPQTALMVPQSFWDAFYLVLDVLMAVLGVFGAKGI